MNIASLNRVEKKIRDVFFDVLIVVRQSLVMFPVLVADGLFVDVLLGANWIKAVSAHLDINRLEIVVDKSLGYRSYTALLKTLFGLGSKTYTSECVEVAPGGFIELSVVHCLVP